MLGPGIAAALSALLTAAPAAEEPSLVLVADGAPKALIVVPARAYPSRQVAREAAEVLAAHLAQMSGATLRITDEETLGEVGIEAGRLVPGPGKAGERIDAFVLVGEGALAKRLGVTAEALGPGGIRIATKGNALLLLGSPAKGDPRSTRYAVIEFLEALGCRYLWPGPTGKVVPKRATVTAGPVDRTFTPPIAQRNVRYMGFSDRMATGLGYLGVTRADWERARAAAFGGETPRDWLWWHRLGGDLGIRAGHAFGDYWERYGKDHPDWFAFQADGTRDQTGAGDRERLCVSNPGLIDAIARDIIERVNTDPSIRCVSLSPNDGGYSSFCMCDACKALDPPEAPKVQLLIFKKAGRSERTAIEYPSLTDRYVFFWNAIAEKVTKVHPDLLFAVDAYSAYQAPPVRRTLHRNCVVRYVPSTRIGWEGWRERASRIFWRPNILNAGRREGTLLVYGRSLADTFQYVADHGAIATDFDSILDHWAVHGLNYYVAARLNWDPHLTYDAILRDYCAAGFGAAAEHVERYFRLAGDATDPWREGGKPAGLTPETIAQLRACLDAAERAAAESGDGMPDAKSEGGHRRRMLSPDSLVRRRVGFLRVGLDFTDRQVRIDALAEAARTGAPFDRALAERLMTENFHDLRRIVARDHLAVNAAYLAWGTGNYAKWRPLGWSALHGRLLAPTADAPAGNIGTDPSAD